jgi:hypothetical protein
MKLTYKGREKINADYATVWTFINDPNKLAQCLPEVQQINIKDDKNFDAYVKVGMGSVRDKFKFAISLEPQSASSKMLVKVRAGGLGTAVDLEATANIKGQKDKSTILDWNGEAVVRGAAATVGARVLDNKAKELISHVFAEIGRSVSNGS